MWAGSELLAYAWLGGVEPACFDLRPELSYEHPVAGELLDWTESRRRALPPMEPWLLALRSMDDWREALDRGAPGAPGPERVLLVEAFDGDTKRAEFLRARGFEATEHFAYKLRRSLEAPVDVPRLPAGWQLRAARADELEARAALHRAAWHRSRYSAEQHAALRALPAFEPELDVVAVTPEGELAAYAVGWLDRSLGVGSFEPVGTATAYLRRGLGRALQLEGLRRMRERGMHSACIGTAGFNEPAFRLYRSCGFELADRLRTFAKRL